MRVVDYTRVVRHTFAQNRLRAALTLLGVIIGTGSIVLLAGLLRSGQEALVITAQNASEADLILAHGDEPPPEQFYKTSRPLSENDAQVLGDSRLLGGAPTGSDLSREVRAQALGRWKNVRFVGAAPNALVLHRLVVERGRFLDERDVVEHRRVCVIGQEVWRDLFASAQDLRDATLTADGDVLSVVGVLKSKPVQGAGDGTWMINRQVFIPASTFDALYAPNHVRGSVFVRLGLVSQLNRLLGEAEKVVETTLLRRHFGVKNFAIEGQEGHHQNEKTILSIIKILLIGTGVLSLFVGGINIMNIMLVTVAERTREIGLRTAVGATPRAIMIQFLMEAALIALVGGLLGVIGAIAFSGLLTLVLRQLLGSWNLYVELWSILLGLGLALTTGLCFGIFPAWRAARLDPVEALRSE